MVLLQVCLLFVHVLDELVKEPCLLEHVVHRLNILPLHLTGQHLVEVHVLALSGFDIHQALN